MVVAFYAGLHSLVRHYTGERRRLVPPRIVGAAFLVVSLILTLQTPVKEYLDPYIWACDTKCEDIKQLAAEIPSGASVAASTYLVDQLVDRTNVHLLSDGMRDSNGHLFYADFIILDMDDPSITPSGTLISFVNRHQYVPVDASVSGISLMIFNPAAAAAYNDPLSTAPQSCKVVHNGNFCTTLQWQPGQFPTAKSDAIQ
jgi:hypothetical protein